MPKIIDAGSDAFAVSERNRVRRLHERGRYDRASIYPILDAAMICHIAYVIDGQSYCTPTAFWREGDHLYWHGSSASRMLQSQRDGVPVCLTVTHLDSLVLARCGFNHSVDYRSAMCFGTAHIIDDPTEKSAAGSDDQPILSRAGSDAAPKHCA
jgi:nitroimidazol reductase NimA-like FMN-containing flavoprotein (pyridoxamine 5'-phosphate oxidase superfamily)